MKILMTTDAIGGVWKYSMDLTEGLLAKGIEVVLVCMGPSPDAEQRSRVQKKPGFAFYHHPYSLEWMDDPWEEVFDAGEWLLKIQQKEKADIAHLNCYTHAALDWNCPIIVVGHSCVYTWFEAVKGHRPPQEWEEYYAEVYKGLHAADKIVAPTQSMMDSYENIYGAFANKQVIYNGINLREVEDGEVKEPFVFSMGRLWDGGKNIERLIEAAPGINCDIVIAGAKPDAIETVPDNVIMLGKLTRKEIKKWLGRACIYALPVKYEPFGLSFLEAAASGCALVGGRIATLKEVWGNSMTYVDPDDPEDIASACNYLLIHPMRKKLAVSARKRARKYTMERMTREYVGLYAEVLERAAEPVGEV